MATPIQQDPSGFYFCATNKAGCWGASASYIFDGRYPPDNQYMLNNATLIMNQLRYSGWDKRTICAILGNMCAESYLNAGQTQIGYSIGGRNGGTGLVMWTPQTDWWYWARNNDHSVNSGYWQTYCVDTQDNVVKWQQDTYYNMTYGDFKVNVPNYSVEYLTDAFFYCFEGSTDTQSLAYRRYCANWYATYFFGYDPNDPTLPDQPMPAPTQPTSDPTPWRGFKIWQEKGMPIWMYPTFRQRR